MNPLKDVNNVYLESYIPDVGELMLASFATALPELWWVGEKYDGVRACWNGKKWYNRRGKELFLPSDVDLQAGETFLDGELWYKTIELL